MHMVLTLSLLSSASAVTIVYVLSFTRKALQETYMNNTFVHLAVILMHSFAATTGDYQRFSAFFIIVGKKKEKKHLRY